MTGKKETDAKVLGKKHHSLGPKKLDLKKEKEAVKGMGLLLAETKAVQAELTGRLEDSLLSRERRRIKDTAQNLRQVNLVGAQLRAAVDDYIKGLLDDLEQADQDKGNGPAGTSGRNATI